MKLFLVDETDYVVALDEAEARQHVKEVTGEDVEEVEEFSLTAKLSHDDWGDITVEEFIERIKAKSGTFPAIIGGNEPC